MSQDQSTMHTEDIDLDETGAESVIGGASAHKHMTVAQAEKAGYTEIGCEKGGGTLMKNMKTGKEIVAH